MRRRVPQVQSQYEEEITRLRRINGRLVAALRVARAWMPVIPPVDECAREDCEIVEAALHSATETKDGPT